MFSTVQNAFQQLHDVIVQALHLTSEAKQLATLPGIHTVQHHVRHRAIQLCDPLLPELFQLRPPHVRIRRIEAERHPQNRFTFGFIQRLVHGLEAVQQVHFGEHHIQRYLAVQRQPYLLQPLMNISDVSLPLRFIRGHHLMKIDGENNAV